MSLSAYQDSFPKHIAIIMDGNGRWARARHRPRVYGHQAGVKTVRRIVEDAGELGVKHLTLYSFSTENWTRPKAEIAALFSLLKKYVDADLNKLNKKGVRITILGSRAGLPDDILEIVEKVERVTYDNSQFYLNIAFNYGGRDEIIRAYQAAISSGLAPAEIDEAALSGFMDTAGQPDPDLVIRTSGEARISNFLIWQSVYSEFVFSPVLWPDFSRDNLEDAISEFQNRNRRFGALDSAEVA